MAHRIAREVGLRFVYEGNIHGGAKDTLCPGCGATLIRRSWHEVTEDRRMNGCCPDCGRTIPGVWSKSEGSEKSPAPQIPSTVAQRYNSLNL
jgi:pyruvate formate lyase activating enzyme